MVALVAIHRESLTRLVGPLREVTHMTVLFKLGILLITPQAQAELDPSDQLTGVRRHASGDWGELSDEDRQENQLSLQEGFRLLSAYTSRGGVKFWIITEADRSATTVLLPSDY